MPKHRRPPCRQNHRHTSEQVPSSSPPPTLCRASGQAPSSVLPPTCRRASKQAPLRPAADSSLRQQALRQHSRGQQQAVLLPLLQTLLIVASMVARWGCSSSLLPHCRLIVEPASKHRHPPRCRLVIAIASKHHRPPRRRLVVTPTGEHRCLTRRHLSLRQRASTLVRPATDCRRARERAPSSDPPPTRRCASKRALLSDPPPTCCRAS